MLTKTLDSGEKIHTQDGYIQSVEPAETLFGYTCFSAMIPPMKPENMLILGYGNGTVSELTKKIWGDVKVTGIDLNAPLKVSGKDIVIEMDAQEFVKDCQSQYDYIVIDLYNGKEVCEFIFNEEFVRKLREICSLRLSINLFEYHITKDIHYWEMFKHEISKTIGRNRVSFFKK